MRKKRVLFCASAGGHYTELMQLADLIDQFDSVVMTERTEVSKKSSFKTVYVPYSSRAEGWVYFFKFAYVSLLSMFYFIFFRPKVVVSTGVHSTLPICVLAWIFKRHIIYIETVAAVKTPTMTGKLMYKIANDFYVQWEELLNIYPNAIYGGVIF